MSILDDVTDVQRLNLSDGDVLVVRVPNHLSTERVRNIADKLRGVMPEGVEIVVMTEDITLQVVRRAS